MRATLLHLCLGFQGLYGHCLVAGACVTAFVLLFSCLSSPWARIRQIFYVVVFIYLFMLLGGDVPLNPTCGGHLGFCRHAG
ncbi:hypothetical protein FKM82_000220 [Ascaphus truei]